MRITRNFQDTRRRQALVDIAGSNFSCRLETDWNGAHRGSHPRQFVCHGLSLPGLKFGLAAPWQWLLDLNAVQTPTGVIVTSQGYRTLEGQRIPFMRTRRFFFADPDMLYEVTQTRHLEPVEYVITGVDRREIEVAADGTWVDFRRDGVLLRWQFSPQPVLVSAPGNEIRLRFETSQVETLLCWSTTGSVPRFTSLTPQIESAVVVEGPRGRRILDTRVLHDCLEPDEIWSHPEGEVLATPTTEGGSHLIEAAVRRRQGEEVSLGSLRLMSLDRLAESAAFPMIKPSLIRAMRSLKERMVFGAVPEDDPTQFYIWGTGTWPRCFSVQCLDLFGFHQEAYAFLEFMLDASRQFLATDGLPHLWDNFYITGPRINERLYDLNGHAIKLFEAGKFYLTHRKDAWGKRLREEHYETLRGWCQWLERHMAEDGALLDETESNRWALGFGVFTQAPAAAGVRLFLEMARDAGHKDDVAHFTMVVDRLMQPLAGRLFGDAHNHTLDLPKGLGNCFQTYLPVDEKTRNLWDSPVQALGLSCYSLAAHYFLQDPEVALLPAQDPRAVETLDLALEHLGDRFDPRIITWHLRRVEAHMGYGQGQLLMALLYAQRPEEFRARLAALFEVSTREVGDIYLMQEVLARRGNPNRGNKAHLTYYPVIIATLAGFVQSNAPRCDLIPDLVVRKRPSTSVVAPA